MTVKVQEWAQSEWLHPDISLYREKGDFLSMSGLMPVPNKPELQRAPSWYGFLQYPADFARVAGGFYDHSTDDFILIGQLTSNDRPASACVDFPNFNGPYTLIASALSLGGTHKQNVCWWGDKLYLIASDGNVHAGSSYTAALSIFCYASTASILFPAGEKLFLVNSNGKVYRLNYNASGFKWYHDPDVPIDVVHALAYHGYLMLFCRSNDGAHFIYRLRDNNPGNLQQVAVMPYSTGEYAAQSSMFAHHDDKIYFCPGVRTASDYIEQTIDIYCFNGSSISHVARIPGITTLPTAMGLLAWRGELLFYALADGAQTFKILIGSDFVDFAPNTATLLTGSDTYSAGGELGMPIEYASLEGLTYLIGSGGGTLTTSRLDMGHPGIKKNLIHLTAIVDQAITDFNVVLEYRIDNQTGWTTAITVDEKLHVKSPQLNVEFYTLQLRVTFDDQTAAGAQDVRLQAISAVYSIGV